MSMQALPFLLCIALLIAALSVAARRIHIPSSMLMLLAGIAVSFTPGAPGLTLDPDLVLLLLLPPLLYSSGVGMSWRGFRSNLRPILLLAIGCVLFTTATVAAIAHLLLGMPWALGFVLGAIVSPPDAVAPMAILRRLGLPRRLLTVLEGESLVNDATALVAFSFALGAVASGTFSPRDAVLRFAAIVAGEISFGLALGWVILRLRNLAADPRAEVLLALATPFIAFWPPHAAGGSGVIACVTCGLFVSWNGRVLIRPATRLQGYFIWDLVVWSVEALLFLLTGLQARAVVEGLAKGDLAHAIITGIAVSVTVILVRFLWVYPATYLPRLIAAVRKHDPMPDWRLPFMVSFTGLRGVVSLAAALSIPLTLGEAPFPDRDLVLFATFSVIAATMLGQGALLPWVIHWIGLERIGHAEAIANKRDERAARIEGIDAVLAALDRAETDGVTPTAIAALRRSHGDRRAHLVSTADETTPDDPVADASRLQLGLVDAERAAIGRIYAQNRITDESRRRIERELDLEEARVRHLMASAGASEASDGDPAD